MSSEYAGRIHTAKSESVREVNRAIVLGLTRRFAPISRAELARRCGFFPSSVSRIVEELIAEGVLTEERANPVGRGKVPMLLRIRDDYFQVLGIYIQPVETTIAFAGFAGQIHRTWSFPTPERPEAFIEMAAHRIRALQRELSGERIRIRHIGVGVPGFVDAVEGHIICVSCLPAYSGFGLAEALHRATGLPVSVDNDCNLGALSELRRIEARAEDSVKDFLCLSVGDYGVGAGLVLHGELYRGHDLKFAAEVGHMIVAVDGPKCSCGRRGCFETFVSNSATWRRYKPRAPFRRDRFREMLIASQRGEPAAVVAVEETARYIALAASNIATLLNPAEIVLVGEITAAFPVISHAIETLFRSPHARVTVRPSSAPREAPLLHGAICLALGAAMPSPVFAPAKANPITAARRVS